MTRREFKDKFISESEIKKTASSFLENHNKKDLYPLPLEQIIEFELDISLLSVPGFRDRAEKDGFITSDFKIITLDDFIFNNREERARFTMAHEIGHMFLHRELFGQADIKNVDDFISFQNLIGEQQFSHLEVQANKFAIAILCPEEIFRAVVDKFLKEIGGVEHFTITDLQNILILTKDKFCISAVSCLIQIQKYYPELAKVAGKSPFGSI